MTIVPLDEHRYTPPVQFRRGPGDVIALVEDYWRLAERISATEFVPTSLRRRPEAVLAALLSGAERGLGPMEALRSVHVIEGRPSLSAEAMRALVFAAGHSIDIVETTATKATVIGRRAGSETTSPPFTWTLDRARRARLANKDNWVKYPEAMLLARATAELCRALFPDVIAGLGVTEEISDELKPAPATTRRQAPARRRLAPPPSAPVEPSSTPPAVRELPERPAADTGGIPGADQPSWATQTPPAQAAAQAKATPAAFTRRLNAEMAKAFPDADKATRDRYRHALVAAITRGRDDGPIITSTELTEAEQMAMSAAVRNIVAGLASVADGPDDTIELRGRQRFTVTLEPLTIVSHPADEDSEDSEILEANEATADADADGHVEPMTDDGAEERT